MTTPEWEKFTTNGWILRVPEQGLELYQCASDSSWTIVQGSRTKGFKANSLGAAMSFAVQWYRDRLQRGLDATEGMV